MSVISRLAKEMDLDALMKLLKRHEGDAPDMKARKFKMQQELLDIDKSKDYYHGTSRDFPNEDFIENTFLTTDPKYAGEYATGDYTHGGASAEGANVKPINLPKEMNFATLDDVKRLYGDGPGWNNAAPFSNFEPKHAVNEDKIVNQLKEEGFDGVYTTPEETAGGYPAPMGDEFMVFDPTKIMGKFGSGAGATLAGLAGMTGSEDTEAAFLGQFAKSANNKMLKLAKEMRGKGSTRDEIWKDTGWFHDKDGQWKWELDDSQAKLKRGAPSGFESKLQNAYNSPIFDEYPDLDEFFDDMMFKMGGDNYTYGGHHFPPRYSGDPTQAVRPGEIMLNPKMNMEEQNSTMRHEMQHLVQGVEDFARGGNPDEFFTRRPSLDEIDMDVISPYIDDLADAGVDMDWLDDHVQGDASGFLSKLGSKWSDAKLAGKLKPPPGMKRRSYDPLYDEQQRLRDSVQSPEEQYMRLAGETEARMVQAREGMGSQRRERVSPWNTPTVRKDEPAGQSFHQGEMEESIRSQNMEEPDLESMASWRANRKQAIAATKKAREEKYGSKAAAGGVASLGAIASLLPVEEAQALNRILESGDDVGSITPVEFPTLHTIAGALDKVETPLGPMFPGITEYLRQFGQEGTLKNKAGVGLRAISDLIPHPGYAIGAGVSGEMMKPEGY